jgi:hypothetical protein
MSHSDFTQKFFSTVLALGFLAACSGEKEQGFAPLSSVQPPAQSDALVGTMTPGLSGSFVAQLHPVNPGQTGLITGSASFTRNGEEFLSFVRLTGSRAGTVHRQQVHAGSSCPDQIHDLNEDGFIDVLEAEAAAGPILFHIDDDLSSREAGWFYFPVADEFGNYVHSRETNFNDFHLDLRQGSLPSEDLVAWEQKSDFTPDGLVVIVYGIAPTYLPESVAGKDGFANFQTLPVACGVLGRVQQGPGQILRDTPQMQPPRAGHGDDHDDGAHLGIFHDIIDTGDGPFLNYGEEDS